MTEIFQDKKKLTVNIALALCYAIFTFFIVLHHEIWTDEVQVWQVVKNLSVFGLIKHLINEGHPSFFYLIIMPFAKLNFSIFSMQIICWLSTVLGVFLLLQFSPFKWWCKLAIILSSGFLYFFPVIARSYSILPLLVFLTAILYEKRKERPIPYGISVFLISQVHAIMFAFCSLLALLFGIEIKQENKVLKNNIIAFLIMCSGPVLVIAQLFGSVGSNTCLKVEFIEKPVLILNVIVEFFANTINDVSPNIILILVGLLAIFFLYLLGNLYKASKKIFWLTFLSIVFQISVYIAVYPKFVYATRIFSAYLILIFGYWIVTKENKDNIKLNIILAIYFLISTYNGFLNCYLDYKYSYTGASITAEFIRKNIGKNDIIFYQNPNVMLPVIYKLQDYNLFYAPYNEKTDYIIWEPKIDRIMAPELWTKFLNKYLAENNISGKDIYILQVKDFYTPIENTEIIYLGEGYKARFENYVLLKYNPPE